MRLVAARAWVVAQRGFCCLSLLRIAADMERSLRCVALLALVIGMIHLSHATRLPIQGAGTSPARKLLDYEVVIQACNDAYTATCQATLAAAADALKTCLAAASTGTLAQRLAAVKNCYDTNKTTINAGYSAANIILKTCLDAAKVQFGG
jgi:hypothetical protein